MASPNAIADVIDMFIDAPLQFIPRDTGRTGELWLSVFQDIPDAVILQAGRDYLKSETEWPSPAKLREIAIEIKRHNGASVRHDDFNPEPNRKRVIRQSWIGPVGEKELVDVVSDELQSSEVPGIYRVSAGDWKPYRLPGK